MLEAARQLASRRDGLRFVAVAASPSLAATMQSMARDFPSCRIETGNARDVMSRAIAGVVASGTATLEAAMCSLPHCIIYKVAWPTYFAGRLLIRVPHLGIVNILAGRELVREFIQSRATPENIAAELTRLLDDEPARARLQRDLAAVVAALGRDDAHKHAADEIARVLENIVSRDSHRPKSV
jgi:lipid-A-disaccharide synthase